MQKNHFLLLKKFKNTEIAQLLPERPQPKDGTASLRSLFKLAGVCVCVCVCVRVCVCVCVCA